MHPQVKTSKGRLRAIMAASPDARIRVHTFQAQAAWEAALRRGYLTGSGDFGTSVDDGFSEAYDWMRDAMARRLPGHTGDRPVWAYLGRPNLRQTGIFQAPTVLITADVPRARILVSDFHRWHCVLNGSRCSLTEAEFDSAPPGGRGDPDVVASWERIFDLGDRTDPEILRWHGPANVLQACVDRIYVEEAVRVSVVRGRVGRNRTGGRCPVEASPDHMKK